MVVSAFSAGHLSLGGVVVAFEAMVTGNGDLTINADPATVQSADSGGKAGALAAGSAAGLGSLPPQILLGSTGSAAGSSPASAPTAPESAGTPAAAPEGGAPSYHLNTGGKAVALSGASAADQADYWMAAGLDALANAPAFRKA
jgi:hypothetical protein